MESSQLENLKDSIFFMFLKIISKDFDIKNVDLKNIISDYKFINSCDTAGKMFGIKLDIPLDYNYLVAVLELNKDLDFTKTQPNKKIERPILKKYSLIVDEYSTQKRVLSYEHLFESYSENLVVSSFYFAQNEDAILYWDGIVVVDEIIDSVIKDVNIDKSSIEKID